MNLGDKIKQLRTEKNWTQPQLAEVAGIEQSYLSKLENDKSVPSAEIFQALLKALTIDVGSFLVGIDEPIVHRQLRQIPDVANHLNAVTVNKIRNIRRWLYGSAFACVVGLTLVIAGYLGLVFSDRQFNYQSEGVFFPNEPADIFQAHYRVLSEQMLGKKITYEESQSLEAEFQASRARPDWLLLSTYQGKNFTKSVTGGTRHYHLDGMEVLTRPENRYLMLLGALLTFGGLFGFIVETKLRKII